MPFCLQEGRHTLLSPYFIYIRVMQKETRTPDNVFARFLRRKSARYVIITLLLVVWMMLFDPYGYFPWKRLLGDIRSLEREKEYYIEKTLDARRKINELQGSREMLEKFAREQYLMKRPDEELFIINDD